MTKDMTKPLIIYLNDDDEVSQIYSEYEISGGLLTCWTEYNKIIIPLHRLLKIKIDLNRGDGDGERQS